jgi:hypothetical protein
VSEHTYTGKFKTLTAPDDVAAHHDLCTCDKCMPMLTVGGAVCRGPFPIEADGEFETAMREVQSLRTARSETLYKLFRLSLCQTAIRELKE